MDNCAVAQRAKNQKKNAETVAVLPWCKTLPLFSNLNITSYVLVLWKISLLQPIDIQCTTTISLKLLNDDETEGNCVPFVKILKTT